MIKKYLEEHYNINRLHNSYLINIDAIDLALDEVKDFIKDKILTKGALEHNPDYMYIQKIDSTSKNISVEQIRQLQNFLHKTSVISGKKIALIYAADKMNINAANCCLKILEEPPANTYLFLLTENAASILPTIRSRCVKINHHYDNKNFDIQECFIKPLLKKTPLADKLAFIKEFAVKDRDVWIEFSSSLEALLAKFCRKMISSEIKLSSIEQELFAQLNPVSPQYLQIKYEQIKLMIDETNEFDLDLRASCTLIIDKFRK
ncbi:MAG: DNA polymerase III subunit delta' [Rickettsiaceae bacterium]|nr:DNA polymerase III subunit delta' [Rickettsiaceae bacterium]MDP4832580.1 DNA polymerase III subunit delta' [Rickettsiaceae bacterium]MDP5020574.1 DNA polymerase III subunit delta' [Rickettsiaceae bacterium]MDP5083245.1 DNA polymerase III subunit delta' [Rickettsiaceae bacterium]